MLQKVERPSALFYGFKLLDFKNHVKMTLNRVLK